MGSAPSFPHGAIDDFEGLSAIAVRNKCGLHVDACLGSFVLPFVREFGGNIPKFDFSLAGVTSISVDHHKYGLAPKGVSVILYKSKDLRKHQYFSCPNWQGGIYGTPTFAGSRSGAPIAGAWFAMAYNGYEGYKEHAVKVLNSTKTLKNRLQKIPELELMGDPQIHTIAFTSKVRDMSIYALMANLTQKGWKLATLQNPPGIHISVTEGIAKKIDLLIKDIQEGIIDVRENPEKYKNNKVAALYGTTSVIPDQNILDESLFSVLDVFLEIAKEK